MSVNRRRLERSSEASSCLEHSLKVGVHLFLLNKFAAFGRYHSFFHGGKKAGFLVEIASNNVRRQSLGADSGLVAICASCACCSGATCTSMALKQRESLASGKLRADSGTECRNCFPPEGHRPRVKQVTSELISEL